MLTKTDAIALAREYGVKHKLELGAAVVSVLIDKPILDKQDGAFWSVGFENPRLRNGPAILFEVDAVCGRVTIFES